MTILPGTITTTEPAPRNGKSVSGRKLLLALVDGGAMKPPPHPASATAGAPKRGRSGGASATARAGASASASAKLAASARTTNGNAGINARGRLALAKTVTTSSVFIQTQSAEFASTPSQFFSKGFETFLSAWQWKFLLLPC